MRVSKWTAHAVCALMLISLPVLPGCAPRVGGNDYSVSNTRQAQTIYHGTVISVHQVSIDSSSENRQAAGGVIGSVAGGFIGNTIGRGSGRTLATVGGALLGGALGMGVGNATARQTGQEITVKYENGSEESIVQGMDPVIYAGQRVRILVDIDGARRVVPE